MASTQTQISAYISGSTKEMVERYTEAHGVKKAHLIEEALLHHLQALRELPADIVIPPRIVVDAGTAALLQQRLDEPREPTAAMKELFEQAAEK